MGWDHSTNGIGAEVISTVYFHPVPVDCRGDKQKGCSSLLPASISRRSEFCWA